MQTRWGAGLVAAVVGVLALGLGPVSPAGAAEWTTTHHLELQGVATPTGSQGGRDVYAGRALEYGYNRQAVYSGTTATETFDFWCKWTAGTIKLIERDGSTLTVEIVPEWRLGTCLNGGTEQIRSQDVVVTGGTGKFAGVTGSGHVDLRGSTVALLEGDLVLTLST